MLEFKDISNKTIYVAASLVAGLSELPYNLPNGATATGSLIIFNGSTLKCSSTPEEVSRAVSYSIRNSCK